MKTLKTIMVLGVLSALVLSSCDNPTALGAKLDLDGPVVTITAPVPRKPVSAVFSLEGEVKDYSPIKKLIITASIDETPFVKQWRYENGVWAISEDSGANWRPYSDATWSGSRKAATWTVLIDLEIEDEDLNDGEYTFAVQAWDSGNMSDDNSYRTIVLIVDHDPPSVAIINPFLYDLFSYNRPTDTFNDSSALGELHEIENNGPERKEPSFLGKFVTQEFPLQWQIEDNHDVWSIELFLYEYNADIDGDSQTPLPDGYIYRYYQNLPPIPERPNPQDYIKPYGSIEVPALDSPQGDYDDGGRLENPISGKTTIMVVAVCYDAAGNPNQEKNLGYFVYWPLANEPFIIYPGDMQEYEPDHYYDKLIVDVEPELYMIYPGKGISANAFHPHGVKEVVYNVYKLVDTNDTIHPPAEGLLPLADMTNVKTENTPRPNGEYSNVFKWEVKPLSRSGIYLIEAYAYDTKGYRNNEPYAAVYRIQDITFPDFPEPPEPVASIPLFAYINTTNNTITVKGPVTDTTEISSLKMVWINPKSRNYATMSQLAYFRDVNYAGWAMAPATPGTSYAYENIYGLQQNPPDTSSPNKVWNVPLTDKGFEEDNRRHYEYSLTIDLADHLGIGTGDGQEPLNSQVFLLRAENPDKKSTVITYAPQGDTVTPSLKIDEVIITNGSGKNITCRPSSYTVIEKFANNDVITIKGTWDEDSTAFLNIQNYFKPNFVVTVNGYQLSAANIVLNPATGTAPYGTNKPWTATMTVGAATMTADSLKDTLVIAAKVHDIGGNDIEAGSSWLIESDHLRLMRISSEEQDDTYTTGKTLKIFLEFSKPVRLATTDTPRPQLILNSATGNTAIATYVPNDNQSSRQYFEYSITSGHNTPSSTALNVTGLLNPETWSANNYRFTWYRGIKDNPDSEYEEIRVTNVATHNGDGKEPGYDFYVRNLPTTATQSSTDYQFTLIAGKQIFIDTARPTASGISPVTKAGWYSKGTEIYFTVRFNEPVKISGIPVLSLNVANGASVSSPTGSVPTADLNDVRVDGSDIIFVYKVKEGDTTNGAMARVTGLSSGTITDLAGNSLNGNISGDINGIYIDTILPGTPTVRVVTNATNPNSNVASNNIGTGMSDTTEKDLKNLYNENLWLAIQGNTTNPSGTYKLSYLEYSIDGGTNWVRAPNTANTPFALTRTGEYNIVARQTDNAGNQSADTEAVKFTWDRGALVTRISSSNSNGTYKENQAISITVTFRKPVSFSGTPRVQLNARNGNTVLYAGVSGALPGTTSSLTFSYTVGAGHTIPTNDGKLDVTGFDGIVAADVQGVTVSNMITLPTATDARLGNNKEIRIDTAALTATAPVFTQALSTSGIRDDDGSYWTTLDIVFSKPIYKGTGNITITQNAGTSNDTYYRLPIVLTEAQYNRFSVVSTLSAIGTYYTKGTNGYINGQGSDTTPKYVLNYANDPNSNTTTVPTAFVGNFRTAEAVAVNVASSIVTIDNNTRTLRVKLEGSNAPQVPGATYTVTYDAGLVVDALDNLCPAGNYTTVNLSGVAKPFVRIQKTQDTIAVANNPSLTQPRLTATQPFRATARMETRTPGAVIRHTLNEGRTNVNARGGQPANNNNWSIAGNPDDASSTVTTRPGDPSATSPEYNGVITLGNNADGNAPDIANVQGYQWWVIARAYKGGVSSLPTEEVAYRTVITYQLRNAGNAISASTSEQILATGDQIWIRGGDAIGSSSIPGFPFTWEDNWDNLVAQTGKRAGIRLMSLVETPTNLNNNSLWRFVTWDINTNAYVDMIMGRDTTSQGPEALRYGPRQWAYQRAGWTSFKDKYPIYPGKHRWLDAGYDHGNPTKGAINFSGTFGGRPPTTFN